MAFRTPPPQKKNNSSQPQGNPATPAVDASVDATQPDLKLLDEVQAQLQEAINKGFDPYNSGAFDFRHTWQQINRRK